MSNGTHIDSAALAAARERLEEACKYGEGIEASIGWKVFEASQPHRPISTGVHASDLRLVLDALRDARERHDWMIDQAAWLRHEHTAYVAVPVPLSSDLSSKATRAEAVDRAFQAHRAALAAKEQQP